MNTLSHSHTSEVLTGLCVASQLMFHLASDRSTPPPSVSSLFTPCFLQLPRLNVTVRREEVDTLTDRPTGGWRTGRGRVEAGIHPRLQPSPPSALPRPPSCSLNEMVRPNECPMISDEAFNMNSVLMTVLMMMMMMMLLLWTPMWK